MVVGDLQLGLVVGNDSTSTDTPPRCRRLPGQTNKEYTDEGEHHTGAGGGGDDSGKYEFGLGEEVYVQEIDAVW